MNRRQFLQTLGSAGTVASAAPARDNQNAQSGGPPIPGRIGSDPHLRHHEFWVSPNGNDANNGLSWETAKRTILAAYDALPPVSAFGGGTIYISGRCAVGGSVTGQGLWIAGPGDSRYNNLPAGWRQYKHVSFMGVPGTYAGDGIAPNAGINGDSMTGPAIWLSGLNSGPMRFENLEIEYPPQCVRLGFDSGGVAGISTADVSFFNCKFNPYNAVAYGPGVKIGNCFWIWFDKCTFEPVPLASTADQKAAILCMPDSSAVSRLYITDSVVGVGRSSPVGVRYHASGPSAWSIVIRNMTIENLAASGVGVDFLDMMQPVGGALLDSVEMADQGAGAMCIRVAPGADPGQVVALNCDPVTGPATMIGNGLNYSGRGITCGLLTAVKAVTLKRTAPTYGATVSIDASRGNEFDITVTDTNAFTIANPTNPTDGQRITITVRNASGRAMGATTWGAKYKLAAWANPASANSRSIDFRYDGVNWVEIGRTPNDVPN